MMRHKVLKPVAVILVLLTVSGLIGNLRCGGAVNWALLSTVGIIVIIVAFFWRFEKSQINPRQVAVISTMGALAAVSRIPFAGILGLQPTTFIVMITGYVFGVQTGFAVGAVAALVSNFFLGQGPWTPWQMFCWGLCGIAAGMLARHQKKGFSLAIFAGASGICGYLFGWIMDIFYWVGFVYPLTWKTFVAAYAASFPADTLHAAGNVVFSVIFGRQFYSVLSRFRTRFWVEYVE